MELKFQTDADAELYKRLEAWAAERQQTAIPVMPVFVREDGTVNIEKMRDTPALCGFSN